MTREMFDQILIEEGVEDVGLRDDIWRDKPASWDSVPNVKEKLRDAARRYKKLLPELRVGQALHRARAREYGWEEG